jgi:hypothetical protein
MARKRVFLDECNSDLGHVFGPKDHVYTARDFGIAGKEDSRAIDEAVRRKCSIVTVNKDFLHYYRDHPMRKGKWGKYGYGLIFLKPASNLLGPSSFAGASVLLNGTTRASTTTWYGFQRAERLG